MKFSKLLLAVVGATVLLGALVTSASARNLSVSSQTKSILWTRMDFRGGFETVTCEVKLSGSFHTRTSTKTINSLLGYFTEGTVLRCARGSATINQLSFPWHLTYQGFTGTLPNIGSLRETVSGAEWTIREPIFGVTCTVRSESRTNGIIELSSGTAIRSEVEGISRCGSFTGTLSGSTTNITNGAGARITITLI